MIVEVLFFLIISLPARSDSQAVAHHDPATTRRDTAGQHFVTRLFDDCPQEYLPRREEIETPLVEHPPLDRVACDLPLG